MVFEGVYSWNILLYPFTNSRSSYAQFSGNFSWAFAFKPGQSGVFLDDLHLLALIYFSRML